MILSLPSSILWQHDGYFLISKSHNSFTQDNMREAI